MTNADDRDSDTYATSILESGLGMFRVLSIYLGDRLGIYAAMKSRSNLTAPELAAATGCQERYVREWLEQQAVAGLVAVTSKAADGSERRYALSPAAVETLTDGDSLNYMAPIARLLVSIGSTLPELMQAFRSGGGVSWAAYGEDARVGQSDINRPTFLKLIGEWLSAVPDVDARLRAEPAARIADIGCGGGWSAIGLARHYPLVRIDGYDVDPASIELAQANLAGTGLEDRVRFHLRDAADPGLTGRYDLVTAFEMIHDLAHPINVLKTMCGLLADGGSVVVVDEKVAESFYAPGGEIEQLMYGWSLFMCLTNGMSETPSAATGTVMRPAKLQEYARAAGLSRMETVALDHPFFRLYRLQP